MEHYLDNSATTPILDCVLKKMNEIYTENYGNPSSLHEKGYLAQKAIEESKKTILSTLTPSGSSFTSNQLIFTSCGTEASNLAILGFAGSKARNAGKKFIFGETEHASVINCAKHLESLGYKVAFIPSPKGKWDMKRYASELTQDTVFVSAMLVNNETGAVNNINEIASMARAVNPDVIIHCDLVQGYMKFPKSLFSSADMLTISAHKIGGPKGVGALYVSGKVLKLRALSPVMFGGGQENGFRSGTENVAGIAGFAEAVKYYSDHSSKITGLFEELNRQTRTMLGQIGDERIVINTPESEIRADHIINVTVRGIRSETMLHFLSSKQVYVSSGSACASNTNSRSHVLKSFGLEDKDIDSSIRISFGVQNTKEDVDALVSGIQEGLATLSSRRK